MTKIPKTRFVLIGTALLAALLFLLYHTRYLDRSFQRIDKDNSGIPVKIKLLKTRPEPFLEILTKLTLTNNFNTPRWYLFPIVLGDTLPPSGYFDNAENKAFIQGRKYPVEKSNLQIVTTQFFGKDEPDNTFLAFYLPPQSTVSMENYTFFMKWAQERNRQFEVWEVENLMVDGKISFEKWLPYNVLCSSNVQLTQKAITEHFFLHGQCLECDHISSENQPDNFLKREVSYIQAVGIRRLSIKLY